MEKERKEMMSTFHANNSALVATEYHPDSKILIEFVFQHNLPAGTARGNGMLHTEIF